VSGDRAAARLPRVFPVVAAVALLAIGLPILALFLRANWPAVPAAITSQAALQALSLSLRTAFAATLICLFLGVPLAVVLARSDARPTRIAQAVITLPLVLPPMVGGLALLYLLGRRGLIGQLLFETWGIALPFTTVAVVIAQVFVALPFLVISLEGALRTQGVAYETTAATLGAGPWRRFWQVTLPLARPGLISGRSWPSPAPWASSGPRRCSPATRPARPGPCPWPSTRPSTAPG
jgi:molybdate transport system permease protein